MIESERIGIDANLWAGESYGEGVHRVVGVSEPPVLR